jgi:hypothetical protein
MSEFYLQDSRDYVGDGLSFWAQGGGYTTNLDKAEVRTRAHAVSQHECRETDVPWPKAYIDERAHYGVDCQLMKEEASDALLVPGSRVYLHVPRNWNGNDVYWIGWSKEHTADLGRACNLDLGQTQIEFAGDLATGVRKVWSAEYIDTIRRRLVWRQDVDLREALRGTGIKLVKPKKPRMMMFNCVGCGRFISDDMRYQHHCRNCGASNTP